MIIPSERFRDEELFDTRAMFEAGGHHVVVASTHVGECLGSRGGRVYAEAALDAQRAADYDAIVFVGGGGSKLLWRDEDALRLAREAADSAKVLGAICLAPVILGNAGVLQGRAATVAGTEARTIEACGATYTGPGVTIDGTIVTANGPRSSTLFGQRIVELLAYRDGGSPAGIGGGGRISTGRPAVVKAVIFDMDGLMFDTERLARDAWRRAMAEHGYALDDDVYLAAVGRPVEAACRIFVDALGPDAPIHDIEAAKARHLREMLIPGPPLKRGLLALLDGIDEADLPAAVASSTARAEVDRRLSSVDLGTRFRATVGGDEVAHGKPAPDLFLLAAGRLGAVPADCVVLEDSEAGIRAAAAAGMIPVMIPDLVEPSPAVRALAAAVVGSLSEVLGALREPGAAWSN